LLIATIALATLTGCTGDSTASDLAAAFDDDPAVASLELTSADNQPFTGGVSGQVIAHDDLADAEVASLADRLSTYTAENADSMRGRVDLIFDDIRTPITGERDGDDRTTGFALDLRRDPRVVEGRVAWEDADVHVSATVSAPADALALAGELPDDIRAAGLGERPSLRVQNADEQVVLTGDAGAWISAASAVWSSLGPLSPTGIRATSERVTVALTRESDVERARALAGPVAAGVPLAFASDIVLLGDSDGSAARTMLAALTPVERAGIVHVWQSADRAQVTARTAEDAVALIPAVRDGFAATEVTSIRLQSDARPILDLDASIAPTSAWSRAAGDLASDATVTALTVGVRSVDLSISERKADADPSRYAPSLRALAPDGARVCLTGEDGAACLTAADHIEADGSADAAERAFIDAWNAVG
jgi:hypothetical protein